MERRLEIGWAQVDISPNRPIFIPGQMYRRISSYIRDPITATVLVLDNGDDQAILLTADMTEVPLRAIPLVKQQIARIEGLDPEKLCVNVTHTHNSCDFFGDFLHDDSITVFGEENLPPIEIPKDILTGEEANSFLADKLACVIESAWQNRKPGGISVSQDYAVVAFNRRPIFGSPESQKSIMYGDCSREDFVRFESGADNSVDLMYTWDADRNLTGVLVTVPCPSQVCELHSFISADYWCATRSIIREKLGHNIYVFASCGAAGDQNPIDLVRISKHNKDELVAWSSQAGPVNRNLDMTSEMHDIGDRIGEAVLRGLRKSVDNIAYQPVFRHIVLDLQLPIRKVNETDYLQAKEVCDATRRKFSKENPMTTKDVVDLFEPQGVVLRWHRQQESEEYAFAIHILRIGNAAIATNPFELFTEFGLRIKARAKASNVFVIQLANGFGGYLPSHQAIEGGSYSSKPASTLCGPEGGDVLVEATLNHIDSLWLE